MNWVNILMNPWTITVVGGSIVLLLGYVFREKIFGRTSSTAQNNSQSNVVVNNNFHSPPHSPPAQNVQTTINVLFIDDDTRFKIVNILKKNTWIKCQIVKDIQDFNSPELLQADVIFVDIEGVGRTLTPKDEGLGIVAEIKRRYPEKKIIIYSSQPVRDMTNPAFRMAEGVLRKEAQPSEFLRYIEDARE